MKKPSFAVASGPAAGVRRPPEPRPSVVGFPGHSWQAFPKTVPQLLARLRVAGLGRRAVDPLGHGWTSRRRVSLRRPASVLKPKPSKGALRRAPRETDVPALPETEKRLVPRAAADSGMGWERPDVEIVAASRNEAVRGVTSVSGISLPAILFTDDPAPTVEVTEPTCSMEGGKSAQDSRAESPVVPISMNEPSEQSLDESRTDEVWVQARDPKTLVVHWTADAEKREMAESRLGRGRWWVRIRGETPDGPVLDERPADGFEGSAILELNRPGREHVAELGYDSVRMGWHAVAVSGSVTPMDGGGDISAEAMDAGAVPTLGVSSLPAILDGADAGGESLPAAVAWAWGWWSGGGTGGSGDWVEGSAAGASEAARGMPMRGGEKSLAGSGAAGAGAGAVPTSGEWVRPEAPKGRDFWFRVNAEVIVHGSTERDARVTVGGRRVVLRPDGSFSFRFALPNGEFRIPVTAVSRDGQDGRSAAIGLGRTTETSGVVGEHPMTPAWDGSISEWSR